MPPRIFGDHKLILKEKEKKDIKLDGRDSDLRRVQRGGMNRIKIDHTELETLKKLISKNMTCSHHLRVKINENSTMT